MHRNGAEGSQASMVDREKGFTPSWARESAEAGSTRSSGPFNGDRSTNVATTAGTRTYPELETRPGAKILRSQSRIQGGESERTLKRFLQNIVNAREKIASTTSSPLMPNSFRLSPEPSNSSRGRHFPIIP